MLFSLSLTLYISTVHLLESMDQYCFGASSAYKCCLFSFIYLLNIDWWVFILHFGYNSVLLHLCYCSKYSSFGHCELFHLTSVSLWHIPTFVEFVYSFSLLPGITKCSRLILYISHSTPWIHLFCDKPWFLLLENDIRNQELDASCAYCYWTVLAAGAYKTF